MIRVPDHVDDDAVPDGLVRSDPAEPGLGRRRRGRGFSYLDDRGRPLTDPDVVARVKALVLPPAWEDVWICPDPAGHIQAVGTDAAGRRQYRYHDDWTRHRDADKFDRALRLGARMGTVRTEMRDRLAVTGLCPQRVLAGGVRLLDIGVFRSGGEQYAPDEDDDGTFGLATLRRKHVRCSRRCAATGSPIPPTTTPGPRSSVPSCGSSVAGSRQPAGVVAACAGTQRS